MIHIQFPLASLGNESVRITSQKLSTDTISPQAGLLPLQAHPLPPTLAQWQDTTNRGDYFSEIKPTIAGYLVWSEFPIKVYVDRDINALQDKQHASQSDKITTSASARRFQEWLDTVLQVVKEWNVYLPMVVIEELENADIIILRSRPPLKPFVNNNTGELQLPRARTAETYYKFYLRQSINNSTILSHRCTILLSPDPPLTQLKATARHELGHALGIWGHSSLETDALYFSQVRNPPPISPRDINTLKLIYQQPTRLGWALPQNQDLRAF